MKKLLSIIKAISLVVALVLLAACEDPVVPTVETHSVEVQKQGTQIVVKNKLVSEGSEAIIRKGTCLSTHPNPSVDDRIVLYKGDNHVYQTTFSALNKNFLYYVRAFAENSAGISYGEVLEVHTSVLASVNTGKAEDMTDTEVTLYGTVNPFNSHATAKAWFEVWIGVDEPMIVELPILNSNRHEISAKASGLTPGEVYSYRLVVENEAGQMFGETKEFRLFYELVHDYDGNAYWTVKHGGFIFTVRNLETTHFLNGDEIPNVKPDNEWVAMRSPAWSYYNNDPALGAIYGKIYNTYVGLDERGLIEGYRVPTKYEYIDLAILLGWGSIAPYKLKSNTDDWYGGSKGDNSSGFNALPAGARGNNDTFSSMFYSAVFQTTSEAFGMYHGLVIQRDLTMTISTQGISPSYVGKSIRLIKEYK